MSEIKDLKFDDKNFNKHTEFGMSLLEKSLQEDGAGRSILIDKNNNIIAGNGVIEAAGQVGIDKVKVVETTGDEIVAVKRVDVELDSKKGRRMAMNDNAVQQADLDWDVETVKEQSEKWDLDLEDWGNVFSGVKWKTDEIVDNASEGSVKDYDDNVDYNLKNLIRSKVNDKIKEKIEKYNDKGKIHPEILDILRKRAEQCTIFDFDEIIKFYRSGDASAEEKELLEKLYLVFLTPKEALEKGILEIETTTGEIYDNGLMGDEEDEAD